MKFLSTSLIGLCTLVSAAVAAAVHSRDTPSSSFVLKASGDNITDLRLFYSNHIAYLGNNSPTGSTDATNVTFNYTGTSLVASADSAADFVTPLKLAIFPDAPVIEPVAFVAVANSTTTVTDFAFYGNLLSWVDSDGSLNNRFWAEPTDQEDVYVLRWNVNSTAQTRAEPVNLNYYGFA